MRAKLLSFWSLLLSAEGEMPRTSAIVFALDRQPFNGSLRWNPWIYARTSSSFSDSFAFDLRSKIIDKGSAMKRPLPDELSLSHDSAFKTAARLEFELGVSPSFDWARRAAKSSFEIIFLNVLPPLGGAPFTSIK